MPKAPKEKESVEEIFTHDGLSTCEIDGKWYVIHLKYNPSTNTAKLEAKIPASDRSDAISNFKMMASRLDLVGG